MSNSPSRNSIYDPLIDSVAKLNQVIGSINQDKTNLTSFTDYLNQNEAEISKFGKVLGELRDYWDKFDFTKGFQMEAMRKKVEALHPLRLKLAKMGETAKKLDAFPDRYGSKKAIEICRNLALTCMERMCLDETDKVSALVDTNTGKLLEIGKKFESDDYIKDQIMDAIKANKNTLDKFKAYFAELQQYISGFPHSGEDDLAVVKKRIEMAKQTEALIANVGKTIETIKDCCDRYNKGQVVARYASVVSDAYSKMRFADVDKYKAQLNDVEKQARSVISAFENENQELKQLHTALLGNNPDIWKEDNESLADTISSLLKKDSRKASFSLEQLKNKIEDAKRDRNNHIKATIEKYRWLTRRKYRGMHDGLVSRYLARFEYNQAIDSARRERNIKIWKIAGVSTGVVALIILCCVFPWILIILVGLAVAAYFIFR